MEQKKHPQKDFRKRSFQFFLIGLVVAFSSTLVAFEWRTFEAVKAPIVFEPIVAIEEDEQPIRMMVKPTPPLPPPPKMAPKPDPAPIPNPTPAPIPVPVVDPTPVVIPVDSGFTVEPFEKEVIPTVRIADKMPEFKGGKKALYKYLGKNLKYPKMARELGVEAKLYVQFIVNTDGSISDVAVLREEGFGLDEEAVRVISEMPNWNPGRQGRQLVRVIYMIPINFELL